MKFNRSTEQVSFLTGMIISACIHVLGIIVVFVMLEISAAKASKPNEIFSVTLEGGQTLGGIGQVPTNNKPNNKVLPAQQHIESTPDPVSETVKETAKIETPSVVEENKKEIEKKKREAELKKKELEKIKEKKEKERLEQQKKVDEAKKQLEKEKKEKQEQEERKKKLEQDKKQRLKQLQKAVANATNNPKQYEGESANAGGQGFGAASLGGKGMGGGTVADIEYIAYLNTLEKVFKAGWRWLPGTEHFIASVQIKILPSGVIQDAQIEDSSGNSTFDDSALRAVFKASPVPAPPERYYEKFKDVTIKFDSHDY